MASDHDEIMGALRALYEQQAAGFKAILARLDAQPAAPAPPEVDLDGQYGNPEIRKDPPRWKGDAYKGRRMSECPPEYLDELAGFFDWTAGRDEESARIGPEDECEKKAKYARYARTDAARARGWAKRLRDGWKPPEPTGDASTEGWG